MGKVSGTIDSPFNAMKLHVLSDLHREFAAFEPDAVAVDSADVVILAGDINLGIVGIEWAAEAFRGKPVVYVCGNHELYGHHWENTLLEMRIAADDCGVHFLEDNEVVIRAVRFLGAALWTDFCLYGETRQHASMQLFKSGLNDCRRISAATPLSSNAQLSPALVLQRHEQSRAWLQRQLAKPLSGKTVVITHHAPSGHSVAPRFRDDPLTPGFASDLPNEMLEGADLWVHGHMHDSCAYEFSSDETKRTCSVLCNPRGYPLDSRASQFENAKFDPALLVEI